MQYISINICELLRSHYTIMHTASELRFLYFRKVMPDDGLGNQNVQHWLTNIKVLCLTVIIACV